MRSRCGGGGGGLIGLLALLALSQTPCLPTSSSSLEPSLSLYAGGAGAGPAAGRRVGLFGPAFVALPRSLFPRQTAAACRGRQAGILLAGCGGWGGLAPPPLLDLLSRAQPPRRAARAFQGWQCLRVRPENRPPEENSERGEGFLLPKSPFRRKYIDDTLGTFETEMEALDALDEEPESFYKDKDKFDDAGDVRVGLPWQSKPAGMSTQVVKWNERSEAAKRRWQDPELKDKMMAQRRLSARVNSRTGKSKKKEKPHFPSFGDINGPSQADTDAPAPANGAPKQVPSLGAGVGQADAQAGLGGGEGSGEAAGRRRKNQDWSGAVAKRKKMREDPRGWLEDRLKSTGPVRGSAEWRQQRRKNYSEAAKKRELAKTDPAALVLQLMRDLGLDRYEDLVVGAGYGTRAALLEASNEDLIAIGLPKTHAARVVSAVKKRDEEELHQSVLAERKRAKQREYMREYRLRKKGLL